MRPIGFFPPRVIRSDKSHFLLSHDFHLEIIALMFVKSVWGSGPRERSNGIRERRRQVVLVFRSKRMSEQTDK